MDSGASLLWAVLCTSSVLHVLLPNATPVSKVLSRLDSIDPGIITVPTIVIDYEPSHGPTGNIPVFAEDRSFVNLDDDHSYLSGHVSMWGNRRIVGLVAIR